MRPVLEVLPRIAESESTILLQGETGTGKELVARAIHGLSARRDGPFVAVNCGALPDTLLESELFGYKAGAFTGATRDKPGRFALARGGTLFLDEISEVSPALQVVLLNEGQIELEHLPDELVPVSLHHAGGRKMIETVKALEMQAIREALERNKGNRVAAARELGMHKSTLFRKVRLLGIELPEQDGRSHHKVGSRA
jgi:transcriptional regulator with PAS, ATPase and Fis domain